MIAEPGGAGVLPLAEDLRAEQRQGRRPWLPVQVPLRWLRSPAPTRRTRRRQAYLDTLLRDRERLAATTEVDDWARTESTPSEKERASGP